MVDGHGPLHHFAKCHFGVIFKYGRRYVSKMVKFRKMSITYDKINLTTCKWVQVVPLKILHLLVCSLQGFCMLTIIFIKCVLGPSEETLRHQNKS